ncbi:MAG: hypothetical protein K5886_08710 [Lachnospiraceae bacterium]|nr:hypothetical protein [Lachnospiraceae bacterium]
MLSLKCPGCGANIELDESRDFGFCSYCGYKMMLKDVVEVRHREASSTDRYSDGMTEMTKIMDYFGQISDKYQKREELKKQYAELQKKGYKALTGWGIVITVIGLLSISSGAFGVVLLIVGCLFLAGGYSQGEKSKKEMEAIKPQITQLENEIIKHYEDYGVCPLGIEYTQPAVLSILSNYIRQGRAYNVKEAINLLEDENYKNEMRQIAINTQKAAEEQARAARDMAISSSYNGLFNSRK